MKRKYIYGLIGIIAAASLTGCGAKNNASKTDPVTETVAETITEVSSETEADQTTDAKATETESETDAIKESGDTEEISEADDSKSEEYDENGVIIGDYSGFTYTRDYNQPSEEDVKAAINEILDSNSSREYSEEGTVKDGDTVVVTFTGSIDGKEDANLSGEQEEFTIGDGTFIDDFETKMVGQEAGKEFTFSIDFPNDYDEKTVAGKTAEFTAVIESIAGEETKPVLTDDWVKENTEYRSVEEYKAGIRKDLEAQEDERADSSAISSLLSDLYNASSVTITDEELSAGIDAEKAAYEAQAADQDMGFDEFVKEYMSVGDSEEEETEDYMSSFEEYLKNQVSDRLEREKILASFCEKENVDIGDEAYNAYIEKEAKMYGYESSDDFLAELESVGYADEIHNIFIEVQAGHRLMDLSEEIVPEEVVPESEIETELVEDDIAEENTETEK